MALTAKETTNILQTPKALIATPPLLNPAILTPPPTVETPSPMPAAPKRKRQRIRFVNYLDDDESTKKRRSMNRPRNGDLRSKTQKLQKIVELSHIFLGKSQRTF